MKKRIAIYYDSLWIKGGAERVTAELANGLDADVFTSGYQHELKDWLNIKNNIYDIGNTVIKKSKDFGTLLEAPFRFSQLTPSKQYDIHLFLGFNSIFAAKPENHNVWFCFTPNRMLYDHRKLKASTGSFAKRNFFKLYQQAMTSMDQSAVQNMTTIVAQTHGVKKRIKTYYNKEADVIYSPISTKEYYFESLGDYFLTVGRLVPEKRIRLIAEAFTFMPEKKLVIVGNGPEKNEIETVAAQHRNIIFISDASDEKLKKLYANCLATIYLPIDEDFGLIPLEGMASGKVAIAVNEGGCLETVKNNITGKIISPTIEQLCTTIQKFDSSWALKQKNACITQAKQFDTTVCLKKWHTVFKTLHAS